MSSAREARRLPKTTRRRTERILHRRRKRLALRRATLDFSNDIHALHHPPEGGEPLTVRVSLPSEIQIRLVSYADEESEVAYPLRAGHGNGAVLVPGGP